MRFSPHSLHPSIIYTQADETEVTARFHEITQARTNLLQQASKLVPLAVPNSVSIPLTTVSALGNFDAYINIQFKGQRSISPTSLLVDSGNSTLVVPRWEDLIGLGDYTILGQGTEPWGSPANVVQGPIEIPTTNGSLYTLENCVFYACTGGSRTANFGASRITPWSASGWNTPAGIGVTMQAPLSYNQQYPFAEFDYAPASNILNFAHTPTVSEGSKLVLYQSQPSGYLMLDTIQNLEWMALVPKSLNISGTQTQWPGSVRSSIAMVDTGGGPVFLSDPDGYIYSTPWPDSVSCPLWVAGSQNCNCSSTDIGMQLEDSSKTISYKFTINTNSMPASVQGLTIVMCKINQYMMGQYGMNIGGISALFNFILVDYANGQVGLKTKN